MSYTFCEKILPFRKNSPSIPLKSRLFPYISNREKTGAEGKTLALARAGSLARLENSSRRVKKTEGAGAGRAGWPAARDGRPQVHPQA